MASKKAKELWESGIWLSDAWKAFAPDELVAQFEGSQGPLEAFNEGPIPKVWAAFGQKASAAISAYREREILEKEMKEAILLQLFNGDLIATGYREFPSPGRYAIAIDSDKFEFDDPDWDKQSHSAQGFRYGRIKVTKPVYPQERAANAKGGISAIDTAIDHLILSDATFCTAPRKVSSQKVRDYLGIPESPGNGLSNKNLERAIHRKCGPKRIALKSI